MSLSGLWLHIGQIHSCCVTNKHTTRQVNFSPLRKRLNPREQYVHFTTFILLLVGYFTELYLSDSFSDFAYLNIKSTNVFTVKMEVYFKKTALM